MKAKALMISIISLTILISVLPIVDAMAGNQMTGPGSGPGMDDDEKPGPHWEQETHERAVENGLMFRYGSDSPATSIEGEKTGRDISMKVSSLTFKNQTEDLSIDISGEEWMVESAQDGELIRVTYTVNARWESGNSPASRSSKVNVEYVYKNEMGDRSLDFDLDIEDCPGEGNLSVEIEISTYQDGEACCWSGTEGDTKHQIAKKFTLKSIDGDDMSTFTIEQEGVVNTDDGEFQVETEVAGELENESAIVNVGLAVPIDAKTASIGGSLEILEGLFVTLSEGAREAAEFVIDHIYSFVIGAVIVSVLIIAAFMVASNKKTDTRGRDLQLANNRYYKGPQ